MSTFKKCGPELAELARELMCEFTTHKMLLDARVKVDFIFAYADVDANGMKRRPAIVKGGVRALGYARRLGLKDRAMGRGDAEIVLDGDWWQEADAAHARALLDHELHHLEVVTDKHNRVQWDDLMRPRLRLRPHDFEFGWFVEIARRHGMASQECVQAKVMVDAAGQLLWPDLVMKAKR